MRILLGSLILVILSGGFAIAADINEKLPAGGVYNFKTKWDSIRIECTAEPIEPKLLRSACTCTSYYGYNHYVYRLSVVHVMSNGKQISTPLAEMIETLNECETLKTKADYREVCRVR